MNRHGAPSAPSAGRGDDRVRSERSALSWCALASLAIAWWIVRPVAVGILLGTLAAFVLQPLYERIKPRLGIRWAASSIVLGTTVAAVGLFALLAWAFVGEPGGRAVSTPTRGASVNSRVGPQDRGSGAGARRASGTEPASLEFEKP
jgi:hypothetical protein